MSTRIVFEAYMSDEDNHGTPDHFIDMLLIDSETHLEDGVACDPDVCEIECFAEWGNTIAVAGIACFSKPNPAGSFLLADRATLARKDGRASLTMRFDTETTEWVFDYAGKITRMPHAADAHLTLVFE